MFTENFVVAPPLPLQKVPGCLIDRKPFAVEAYICCSVSPVQKDYGTRAKRRIQLFHNYGMPDYN